MSHTVPSQCMNKHPEEKGTQTQDIQEVYLAFFSLNAFLMEDIKKLR